MILIRNDSAILCQIVFMLTLLSSTITSQGQTPNDNMVDAEVLMLNQFVNSKTHGNTVEARCVDEKLTGKCIDYHNDQWYTFTTDAITTLYINISGQKCRDMRGVQLVVLSGDLCDPTTYTIYDCVSLATQDDIYVKLSHLAPQQKYWLNVDGYLHDFCTFFIEVSDQPKGFSVEQHPYLETAAHSNLNTISIQWTIPDSLSSLAKYAIISKKEVSDFRFDSVGYVPVQFNAYGSMVPSYQFLDTLMLAGNYLYRLGLVLENAQKLFIDEFPIKVPSIHYKSSKNQMIALPLDYEYNTPLELAIINPENGNVLDEFQFSFDPRRHIKFSFYINKYIARGLIRIEVRVINKNDNYLKSHFFNLKK